MTSPSPEGVAAVAAAQAAAMAACGEYQAQMGDPMGSAVTWSAESTQQPYLPPEPGEDTEAGVT